MKLLLTNDDGIEAGGLSVLGEVLSGMGHEVSCIAPERCMSACSHAITLRNGLRVRKLDMPPYRAAYTCSGTPADCVMLALHHVFPGDWFDCVISGINEGLNVAEDIHYSGTVAAAREACIHDVPAVALSIEEGSSGCRRIFAEQAGELLPGFVSALKGPGRSYLNINHPGLPGRLKFRLTRPGRRSYLNFIDPLDEKERVETVAIGGTKDISGNPEGTDCRAVECGEISVTPLDLCCYDDRMASAMKGVLGGVAD